MRLTFPLYLVIDPTTIDASALWVLANFAHLASFIGDRLHADRNPVLYTDKVEADADARSRLAARAARPTEPDLLTLADEAIDAIEDAKTRSTFSSWEVAGAKVTAYREARAKR
jgi:hypothetical protein